jgi:hypothetical protein
MFGKVRSLLVKPDDAAELVELLARDDALFLKVTKELVRARARDVQAIGDLPSTPWLVAREEFVDEIVGINRRLEPASVFVPIRHHPYQGLPAVINPSTMGVEGQI